MGWETTHSYSHGTKKCDKRQEISLIYESWAHQHVNITLPTCSQLLVLDWDLGWDFINHNVTGNTCKFVVPPLQADMHLWRANHLRIPTEIPFPLPAQLLLRYPITTWHIPYRYCLRACGLVSPRGCRHTCHCVAGADHVTTDCGRTCHTWTSRQPSDSADLSSVRCRYTWNKTNVTIT